MRSDLNKVIGDVYRYGRSSIPKFGRTPDSEDLPTREGIRTRYQRGSGRRMKEPNCSRNPVRRFLYKQVGRPWNLVFSEICRTYDKRKAVNKQIYELVDHFVTKSNLFVKDGAVLEESLYRAPSPPIGLYVHPVTGLLLLSKEKMCARAWCRAYQEKARVELMATEKILTETLKLVKVDGIWFMVEFAPVTAPRIMAIHTWVDAKGVLRSHRSVDPDSICRDMLTGEKFTFSYLESSRHRKTYAKTKRQASHRELKQYGLL